MFRRALTLPQHPAILGCREKPPDEANPLLENQMSGGAFEYNQYAIARMADDIRALGADNKREFSEATLRQFEAAVRHLNVAYVYAQRVDWLLSGDDSEDTFHERLRLELEKVYSSEREDANE
jgi:hypothetical protein